MRKKAACPPGLVSVWAHILDITLPDPPVHKSGQILCKPGHDGSRYQPPAASLPPRFRAPPVLPYFATLGAVVVSANTNTLAQQHGEGWGKEHGCCSGAGSPCPSRRAPSAAGPRSPAPSLRCAASRERRWSPAAPGTTGPPRRSRAGIQAQTAQVPRARMCFDRIRSTRRFVKSSVRACVLFPW